MNSSNIQRRQTELSEPSIIRRLWGASFAAVAAAWVGIHFNAGFQAIRAASDTQLQNPSGTHVPGAMDYYFGAGMNVIEVYGIGIVLVLCSVFVVWPLLYFVPRPSFWRLPVLLILSLSLPVLVVTTELCKGPTPGSKWHDAGLNHLLLDGAGYLSLGLIYGLTVWFSFKIYMQQVWRFMAWAGLGFVTVAVPASVLILQHGSHITIPGLGEATLPVLEVLLCIAGAALAGTGWLVFQRVASTRS
jgi:hypothetical protein